jgi:sporulation protein YlmC with PRC-barrel domain
MDNITANTASRETERLIASDKVEGTAVRRSNGDTIGTIQRVMIDKRSGHVAYAIMSFGGFLGMGQSYYPLPWSVLRYNEELDGYEVNLTEEQLRGGPTASDMSGFDFSDRNFGTRVHNHYGARPYWGS